MYFKNLYGWSGGSLKKKWAMILNTFLAWSYSPVLEESEILPAWWSGCCFSGKSYIDLLLALPQQHTGVGSSTISWMLTSQQLPKVERSSCKAAIHGPLWQTSVEALRRWISHLVVFQEEEYSAVQQNWRWNALPLHLFNFDRFLAPSASCRIWNYIKMENQ